MKKPKNFEFFWFFAFLQVRLPSKNQKNLDFFSFFKVTTKKTKKLEENQKKTKHEPQTKHSLKSFGFLVLGSWGGTWKVDGATSMYSFIMAPY